MISCSHCRQKISEFLDEALQPNEREAVAAHLKTCAACAQVARELGNLRSALRETPPVAAPTFLRQNVRAALQNEAKSRLAQPQTKPIFGWLPPQFAWTGTLAFAALTLILLARPFSQITDFQSPQNPVLSSTTGKNQRQTSPSVQRKTAPATTLQKSEPRPEQSRIEQSRTERPQLEFSPQPRMALPQDAEVSRPQLPRKSRPAPRRDAPVSGMASPLSDKPTKNDVPATNQDSANGTMVRKPQFPTQAAGKMAARRQDSTPNLPGIALSRPAPAPTSTSSVLKQSETPPFSAQATPGNSRVLVAPAPATAREKAQNQAQANPASTNTLRQSAPQIRKSVLRESAPAMARVAAPQFSLALRVMPFTSAGDSPPLRQVIPPVAPPAPVEGFTKNGDSLNGRARSGFNASGSLFAKKSARALDAPGPLAIPAPQQEALKSRDFTSQSVFIAPTAARRFRLQIESTRTVKNAQVRLELPPSLRLLWPASKVLWRGDFAANKAVDVEFSLGAGHGQEEISVILEQKSGGAQSRLLQTQTLVLPASSE
ncbi:Transmembrane transcriptional regulator (anti-sigma factor RsiW) [Abditibacterium utsteinense]|uniref:Transmembrane transcriptional regulator (Anti-sigma factor RsiW) n=1 Tax=Abditibacterium utsteinense TaxID=1960156 RepID=A0A2S8SXB8_9BACT|nr:anti-sigma factor [Abditibacterium utsteinense]PQV65447.1 Transmembrane transcriptional regulator (anti-sigma factor RsiW) [Abditibacterium utsteinense]